MFKFELTQEQLNVVAAGLGELPMKIAAPVVQVIQEQLQKAAAAAPAAPTDNIVPMARDQKEG